MFSDRFYIPHPYTATGIKIQRPPLTYRPLHSIHGIQSPDCLPYAKRIRSHRIIIPVIVRIPTLWASLVRKAFPATTYCPGGNILKKIPEFRFYLYPMRSENNRIRPINERGHEFNTKFIVPAKSRCEPVFDAPLDSLKTNKVGRRQGAKRNGQFVLLRIGSYSNE
jgi:hypothetical protein